MGEMFASPFYHVLWPVGELSAYLSMFEAVVSHKFFAVLV